MSRRPTREAGPAILFDGEPWAAEEARRTLDALVLRARHSLRHGASAAGEAYERRMDAWARRFESGASL